MGLIARHETKKTVQDLPTRIGEWANPADAQRFGLTQNQMVTAAVHGAILGSPVAKARSTWIDEKGKHSTAEIAVRTLSSVLRSQGGLQVGNRVTLGTPDPAMRFISDWTVGVRCTGESAVLSVPSCRTQDDQIPNKDALNKVRARIARTLLDGPDLTRHHGPPNFDALVAPASLPHSQSVFSKDFLAPLPACLRDRGCTVPLPAGSASSLADAIDATRMPQFAPVEPYCRMVDLGGGGSGWARLSLIESKRDGDQLVIEIVDSPSASIGPGGHARLVRAVLATLHSLSVRIRESSPAAAAALDSFVDECEAESAPAELFKELVPLWDKDTPAPAIRTGSDAAVPVGIVFRTSAESLLDLLVTAQRWLLVRQRTWSKGVFKSTREKNRFYTARRPSILKEGGSLRPYIRYGDLPDTEMSSAISTSGDLAWYWELGLRSAPSDQGHTFSLLVDGLSIADGYLAYGPEVAWAFRAFCWLLQAADPGADIDTITVRVP